MDPITVCLVGCGKSKLERPAAAKDLYTGSLFGLARRWAEGCDEWRIVSGRYGLVHPDDVIEPYEYRMRPKDKQQWGVTVANRIVSEFLGCGPYEVVILAGADYARPIAEAMRCRPDGIVDTSDRATKWRANCVGVREPLSRMGMFHRVAWFEAEHRRAQVETFARDCAAIANNVHAGDEG